MGRKPKPKTKIIPLKDLVARRDRLGVLAVRTRKVLTRYIADSGLYPPLIVRPHGGTGGKYEIIDGHHRMSILAELGRRSARCEVWAVDDSDAELLSFALNNLRGRLDGRRRGRLIRRLVRRLGPDGVSDKLALTAGGIRHALASARRAEPKPTGEALALRPVFFHIPGDKVPTLERALKSFGAAGSGRAEALMNLVRTAVAAPKPR